MKTLAESLPAQLKADLAGIRSAVQALNDSGVRMSCPPSDRGDPGEEGDRILTLLESWLLDEEQKQMLRLNPWDIFFLYASAYVCHIGRDGVGGVPKAVHTPAEEVDSEVDPPNQSGRVCGPILDRWRGLGIRDGGMAGIISKICRSAGISHAGNPSVLDAAEYRTGDAVVNASLLSAAITLAIALDPGSEVTTREIIAFMPVEGDMTPEQFGGFFTVMDVGPHPYFPGTIRMKIRCRHAEVHRALKRHERSVQQRLNEANRSVSPRFLYSDVVYEIEPQGYDAVDLKFSVDSSAALQLFTGRRLYTDNRVFLRELVQNALDACHLRRLIEAGDYRPAIDIAYNEDISRITVRDNGIGMDRQWIEKYFLKIGISLYQSTEVRGGGKSARIDVGFISQFGIGFLSSFLAADKIEIRTRKAGFPGLAIAIISLRDYFDVRPLDEDFPAGTEVTLHLRESKTRYCRTLEYTNYLKTNLRYLKVPVRLHDEHGQVIEIGNDAISYGRRATADIDFIAPLGFAESEGYLLLRALKPGDHIYSLDTAKGGISVFQDGIFVIQTESLLPEGARGSVVGRINLMGAERCALSMDRNRIFWTDEQLRHIKKVVLRGLATAASRFMAAVEAQDVPENSRRSIINHLAIFFEFNEVDDEMHRLLDPSVRAVVEKRFRDFIRIHFAHTIRTGNLRDTAGYCETWQQDVLASFGRKGPQAAE